MRIDYCPKCNKAGLKNEDDKGRDPSGKTQPERYLAYQLDPSGYMETTQYGTRKWCLRCKEWVKPENHPYIGSRLSK